MSLLARIHRYAMFSIDDECGQDLVEFAIIATLIAFIALLILDQVTPGISLLLQQLFGSGNVATGM